MHRAYHSENFQGSRIRIGGRQNCGNLISHLIDSGTSCRNQSRSLSGFEVDGEMFLLSRRDLPMVLDFQNRYCQNLMVVKHSDICMVATGYDASMGVANLHYVALVH